MILKTRGILLIILMMHSCFIPMSCMTVESYRGSNISKEQFSVDKVRSIHLKSGEKLLMEDTQIRLLKLTNGSVYAFLINAFDTTWSGDKKNYTVSASLDTIGIEDVREITTKETDVTKTFLGWVLLRVCCISDGDFCYLLYIIKKIGRSADHLLL